MRTAAVGAIIGVFIAGAIFVGVRLAGADPGAPGGPTLSQFTFAGVLRERASRRSVLTFVFRKGGATPASCTSETGPFTPDDGGAFTVVVPIDSPSRCPPQFFDGTDVTYDVLLDGETTPIVSGVGIRPVPYARFADQAGVNNDCPAGYTRSTGDAMVAPSMRLCTRAVGGIRDEVVRVGIGATAFWIDRYEATIWNAPGDRQFNVRVATDIDMLGLLPPNGEWRGQDPPLFARSQAGRDLPARWVTWFQAEALCRASGKRLPTGSEWLAAARGTGGSTGEAECHIGAGTEPRDISAGSACVSDWGARDMVGNVWEWTAEWYAGLVPNGGNYGRNDWPTGYGGDRTWNITMSVQNAQGSMANFAIPAAALRGGSWGLDSQAGRFALLLGYGPSYRDNNVGFRCVIPR